MRIIQALLAAILIVQVYALVQPRPGRFVVDDPGSGIVLDTATGHWCAASPKMVNQLAPECHK